MNSYLVIETEEHTIDRINTVINDFEEFNYLGYCQNYSSSLEIILKNMPDLIFLNIDTVTFNPFSFVSEAKHYLKKDSEFIAISSSKKSTYEAIKSGFFDYLLSPISDLDLRKAIINFKKKHPIKNQNTICLKSYKDYRYLNTNEILFLKADNNTTDFHLSDGKTVSAYKTLKTFEVVLPKNFLRIHKSYIVNKNHVNRVNFSSLNCSLKKCLKTIPFTKTYINNIEFMVNALSRSSILNIN